MPMHGEQSWVLALCRAESHLGLVERWLRAQEVLDILSSGDWGCVPSQLVVWHEMSQHWHLQLLGGARFGADEPRCPLLGAVFTS